MLKNNNRVKSAYLFGSRAIGTYKENSDIDIVLIWDELTLTNIAALLDHINKLAVKLF